MKLRDPIAGLANKYDPIQRQVATKIDPIQKAVYDDKTQGKRKDLLSMPEAPQASTAIAPKTPSYDKLLLGN